MHISPSLFKSGAKNPRFVGVENAALQIQVMSRCQVRSRKLPLLRAVDEMIRRLPILASEIAISATDWGKECEQAVQKSGCCIAHESRKHDLLDGISYCGNNQTVGHMGFSLWNEPRFPCSQRPRFGDCRCYLASWTYLPKRILAGSCMSRGHARHHHHRQPSGQN